MLAGASISTFLLLAGGFIHAVHSPGPPCTTQYPIWEEWGPGSESGGNVIGCEVRPGIEPDGTQYWIIVKTIRYSNGATHTESSGKYHSEKEA